MSRAPTWVVVLLVPALALAQPRPSSSPLADVNKELAVGEFDRALRKIDAALKRVTAAPEVAQLYLARGQAYLALGKADKAKAAFASAIQRDPTAELDARRVSPDAVRLFEKTLADFPATVSIQVRDGEANISIDDKDVGPAPLQMQLGSGVHVIEAKAAGGRTARKEVRLAPGRRQEVALELGAGLEAPRVDVPPPPPPLVESSGRPGPSGVQAQAQPGRSKAGLVPLVVGAVLAGGGSLCLWQANVHYDRLVNPSLPKLQPLEQRAAVTNGNLFQTLGWVGVGAGAAAVVAGAVWLAAAPAPKSEAAGDVRVGAVLGPDGSLWVGVQGRLP